VRPTKQAPPDPDVLQVDVVKYPELAAQVVTTTFTSFNQGVVTDDTSTWLWIQHIRQQRIDDMMGAMTIVD